MDPHDETSILTRLPPVLPSGVSAARVMFEVFMEAKVMIAKSTAFEAEFFCSSCIINSFANGKLLEKSDSSSEIRLWSCRDFFARM